MAPQGALTAKAFRDAFLLSYSKIRARFTAEEWIEVWNRWNGLMMKQTNATFLPKIERPILSETAELLGLKYENSQPLRLDAVFSDNPPRDFPIKVAIEHENRCEPFWPEVERLLLVRCPLKVGITYLYSSLERRDNLLGKIKKTIDDSFAKISEVVSEAPDSEYLFLVGTELDSQPKEIFWHSLDFRANDGSTATSFHAADYPVHDREVA